VPELPPRRERELLPRDREALLRLAPPRDDFVALLPLARLAVERVPVDLRAADERLAPELDDFARLDEAFFAPLERDGVEREDFDAPLLARLAVEREPEDLRAVDLRPPVERDEEEREVRPSPPPAAPVSSLVHLPDMTRWAASATASAISDPSFAALDATLLAACCAVSAASRPASRIFFRAAGLAAIAAAAAVSPAASISLLIAALASLSTVLSLPRERDDEELEPDFEELEREELLRADFAISYLPPFAGKTLQGRSGSLMKFQFVRTQYVKGTAT
jgi:hypothetical protein